LNVIARALIQRRNHIKEEVEKEEEDENLEDWL
jgi:hypothetical protein